MKIVLSALSSKYIHSTLAPWCLLAGLKAWGSPAWETKVVEGTVNEPMESLVERLVQQQPDVLGLSCYIWNIRRVEQILPLIKQQLPAVSIVLGGPEVGYCPQEVLTRNPHVDYVLTGEGEKSFALLCHALEQHGEITVAGVTYRTDNGFASYPAEELDNPPSPYVDEYFEALQGRIAYLETSRGCPYSCAYCLSARCGKLKFYDIERAKQELVLLANSGAKTVKLVDRTFNANRERAKELWSFLIKNAGNLFPTGVCFHFEIAGDLLDDETIELLQSAPVGLFQLEIGLQSFHEETLAYIRRKTNITKLSHNIRRVLELDNIHTHIDLIAGLPLEDFNTFLESVNRAYALQPHMLQVGFLKLLHGSPMDDDPHRYPATYDTNPPYEMIENPWLSKAELNRLKALEWVVDKLYNSGRFRGSLTYLLQQTGFSPAALFLHIGETIRMPTGASLATVAEAVYDVACQLPKVDSSVLRDIMVTDWLTHVAGGKLPGFLQIQDPNLKQFAKMLRKNPETCPKPGVQRGMALLYHPLRGMYVDYEHPHPVTGVYAHYEILIE